MPKKTQRKAAEKPIPPANKRGWRIIRGLFGLFFFAAVLLSVGSYFIRREVIKRVRDRSITASSAVYARPFPIFRGLNIERAKLLARLDHLAYHQSERPEHPGEFHLENNRLTLYLRQSTYGKNGPQEEKLVQLALTANKEVSEIIDTKFQQPINEVYLEPEILSLLGDSATRASIPKTIKDFPPQLIHALLAIEDERFYSHFGIDPVALSRAIVVNVTAGRMAQGGSTITQQLAKNLFFTQERTLARKIFEAFAAVLLETAFTKEQILELYLNEIFLGQEGNVAIHGFAEAARAFFGKQLDQLSIAEAATLAGIIKAPTKLSPRLYPKNAKERRLVVLKKMEELNFITPSEAQRAALEQISVRQAERSRRVAPYFVDFIRRKVQERYELDDLTFSQLKVITGLDIEYQRCADAALEGGLEKLEKAYPRLKKQKSPIQAALVAVNPTSGEILAWVGGRDYSENQFDRVSQAKRQPGSSFKPFVYLTALDKDLNTYRVARTTSLLVDEPMSIEVAGGKTWQPKNYDNEYRGEVTLRQALAHSLNIPTVQLAEKVGIEAVARTAEKFGFGVNLPRVPSLALGAGEVSPLEIARAYTALANGGLLVNVKPISAILQENDPEPLLKTKWEEERAASEPAVYVLTNMLQSVIESGTGNVVRRLGFTAPAAGKTGTSNDTRDAWFVGYTPRMLAAVWVGFDENEELKLTGGQAAAPIWAEYMKCATAFEPQSDFVPPPGVVFRQIDRQSGLLFTPNCPPENGLQEVFVEGTEPVTTCTIHNRDVYSDESVVDELPPAAEERGVEILSPPSSRDRQQSFWDKIWNER